MLNWAWWELVFLMVLTTHITIISVTLYLHRSQAHRSVIFHPLITGFFRFWLWLTTGMVTKEWVTVHRKHHATVDSKDDPHSPVHYGIQKLLLSGTELYKHAAKSAEDQKRYGVGTPNDWVELKLYSKYSSLGPSLLFIIFCALFGPIGIVLWAFQMLWIPVMAAGIINGVGHHRGYRNFNTPDYSKNILPFGIIIGGEELHNNHHNNPTSPKLSTKWYEIDIGWWYICLLNKIGLIVSKR